MHFEYTLVGLFLPQRKVQTRRFAYELLVRAALDHSSVLEHEYLVGVDDIDEPMSDANGRATVHERLERVHDVPLGDAVQTARRLVVHKYVRILEHGARDCHALLLATAQLETALAHHCVVLLGHAHDGRVQVRQFRALVDSIERSVEIAVVNVMQDCVVK